MKLPQTFLIVAKKFISRVQKLSSKSKRILVLCGVTLLCFMLVLPFLNRPTYLTNHGVDIPANSSAAMVQSAEVSAQPPVQQPVKAATPKPAPQVNVKDLVVPVKGKQLRGTSKDLIWWSVFEDYRLHPGVDIQAAEGTKVMAPATGTVSELGTDPQFGKVVVIDHGNGIKTVYGQLTQLRVKEKDKVAAGQVLGVIAKPIGGEADLETHLHFEVLQNGKIINGH